MNKPFFRYASLTGIGAILAMLGLKQCNEEQSFTPVLIGVPFHNGDIDNTQPENRQDRKTCFSTRTPKSLPDISNATIYLVGIDIDEDGGINYVRPKYLNGEKQLKEKNWKDFERLARDSDAAEKIREKINDKSSVHYKKSFVSYIRPKTEIPADGKRILDSAGVFTGQYYGNRSSLSLEVNSQSRIVYILLDDNLTFDEELIDITNQRSSSWASPLHNYIVDETVILPETTKEDEKVSNTVLTVDFYSNAKRFPEKNHCRYGVNIHVVSSEDFDPDGTPDNGDEYSIVTPLVIDPIIKNNGSLGP